MGDAEPAPDEVGNLLKHWHDIIARVAKADPLSRRYFLDTAPLRTDATHLVVGYDPEFESEMARFDDSRAKVALAREVKHYVGRMLAVSFEALPPDAPRPTATEKPESPVDEKPGKELSGPAKWYANPVVKTVVDAFNGQITEVRE